MSISKHIFVLLLSMIMNFQYILKCLVSTVIPVAIFIAISSFFVQLGVVVYHSSLIGTSLFGIPVEGILLTLFLSLAGLSIYIYLNHRFPDNDLEKFSLSVSNLLLGVCVAMLFFTYTKWYSLPAFLIFFMLLAYIEYVNKRRFMYRFYRAFLVSMLFYYPLQLVFINLSGASYLYNETIKLKIAGIPFENYFYFMSMFLLTVYLFEFLTAKPKK